jgi:hypothetical protein
MNKYTTSQIDIGLCHFYEKTLRRQGFFFLKKNKVEFFSNSWGGAGILSLLVLSMKIPKTKFFSKRCFFLKVSPPPPL